MRVIRVILAALALLCLAFGTVGAQEPEGVVRLVWNPVIGADGYRVFWGTASGEYDHLEDVGAGELIVDTDSDGDSSYISGRISGLPEATTVFTTVKAYNDAGESAAFSNEVSGWPFPEVSNIVADCTASAGGGAECSVYISGFNFASGVMVAIPYAGVHVSSVSRVGARSIEVALTIAGDAVGGQASVYVRNPWASNGSQAGYSGVVASGPEGLVITPIVLPGPVGGLRYIDN